MTRHDTEGYIGGLHEYVNEKSATEIGGRGRDAEEVVRAAQSKTLRGSEVQKIGRPQTGTRMPLMNSRLHRKRRGLRDREVPR